MILQDLNVLQFIIAIYIIVEVPFERGRPAGKLPLSRSLSPLSISLFLSTCIFISCYLSSFLLCVLVGHYSNYVEFDNYISICKHLYV